MVAQMIVRVRDQNVEHDASPERFEVPLRRCAITTQRVGNQAICGCLRPAKFSLLTSLFD